MKIYTRNFMRKKFESDEGNIKDAYLKACKWVSTNVISKDEINNNVMIHYEKDPKGLPSVTVTLLAFVKEDDLRKRHCQMCKEAHCKFYINENTNCAWCKIDGYQRRIDYEVDKKIDFLKSKLEN